MSAGSNPLLFGRVMALTSDHESLVKGLQQLEELCAHAPAAGERRQPGPGEFLRYFRRELSKHFDAEQSDAYFGVIRADRPSLAPVIAEFEEVHVRLLALSDELIALYETRRWNDLARTAAQLAALFRQHERQESLLMQEFLVRSDG